MHTNRILQRHALSSRYNLSSLSVLGMLSTGKASISLYNSTRHASTIQFRYGKANQQRQQSSKSARQPSSSRREEDPSQNRSTPNFTQYRIGENEELIEFEVGRPYKFFRLENETMKNVQLPATHVTTSKQEMLHFFTEMSYYRRFEIVADMAYKQKLIRGFCHLYDGQEAIITGIKTNYKFGVDSIITSYRDHAYQLAMGDTGDATLSELFGKSPGCARGKGGSMHLYYPKHKFFGGNGIVGAQVPLGTGCGFAHKYSGDGGVNIAAYGDGASNQGQVFEVYNMAKLYNLPQIFLCENNQYGMGTSTSRASSNTEFYTRGSSCNIPGIWIDGMDVLAVKKGFEFAYAYCRAGNGPLVVEAQTYRYHGHSMSDPGVAYRTRDEVDAVRSSRDPIEQVRKKILDQGWATEQELKAIEKDLRKVVDGHFKYAVAAKELPASEIFTDIYANGELPPLLRPVDFRKQRDRDAGLFDPSEGRGDSSDTSRLADTEEIDSQHSGESMSPQIIPKRVEAAA